MMTENVKKALGRIRQGEIVLVYDADDREGETDMVVASEKVTPEIIRRMRKEAGGLICTTVHAEVGRRMGLPFLSDLLNEVADRYPILDRLTPNDIPYDNKSAFSITINHRKTFTGITDNDRALTISEFAKMAGKSFSREDGWSDEEMGQNFRSPGHVILLRTSDQLLVNRFGHTELSTALMIMAGMSPSATICEMMGDDGNALSREKAIEYARAHDLVFLEGDEVIKAWRSGEWREAR